MPRKKDSNQQTIKAFVKTQSEMEKNPEPPALPTPSPPQLVITETPVVAVESAAPPPAPEVPSNDVQLTPPAPAPAEGALSPQVPPMPTRVHCADCIRHERRYDALKQMAIDHENEMAADIEELEDMLEEQRLINSQLRMPEELVEAINAEYMWNPRKEAEEPTLFEKLASLLSTHRKLKTWHARIREEKEVLEVRCKQLEQHTAYLESLIDEGD